MWLVESYGPVLEIEAFPGEGLHARCDPSYREKARSRLVWSECTHSVSRRIE